ncbi:MAG: isoaspartyl peptidase/L-asparaginase [Acidobacteriota bacterium]|nr:isoaspartyl peptidase/L-asparaginase [Acidobacteriota bacterium]
MVFLAVHGGAWNIPDALWDAHARGCEAAWTAGMKVLREGGSAVEGLCAAVRVMEDDPTFDAGYGSFLNDQGEVELEAGLMEGRQLESGAVLGVNRVKNPIDLARHVLQQTQHCIFTRDGAHRLAEQAGFPMVPEDHHVIEREREAYARIAGGDRELLETVWVPKGHDTVGAIAMDREGNLAAGNSTGGTLYKQAGRVGDAGIIGSGFYADNQLGAVICTGWGESIMRSSMAMVGLHALAESGPKLAAQKAVAHLENRVGGRGGIILMAPDGACGAAHNTERMAYRLPEGWNV